MNRFRLIGSSNSPFARKVVLALQEKSLLDRTDLVSFPFAVASTLVNPSLLTLNPLGKIPILEVQDGPLLYESDLICEYLDANYGGAALTPVRGPARLQALQWNGLCTGGLEMLTLWRGERLRPPELQFADLVSAFDAKLNAILAVMDQELPALEKTPYGLAHIAWACFLGYLDFRFDDLNWRARWPSGVAWYDGIIKRPLIAESAHESRAPGALVWLARD